MRAYTIISLSLWTIAFIIMEMRHQTDQPAIYLAYMLYTSVVFVDNGIRWSPPSATNILQPYPSLPMLLPIVSLQRPPPTPLPPTPLPPPPPLTHSRTNAHAEDASLAYWLCFVFSSIDQIMAFITLNMPNKRLICMLAFNKS